MTTTRKTRKRRRRARRGGAPCAAVPESQLRQVWLAGLGALGHHRRDRERPGSTASSPRQEAGAGGDRRRREGVRE
jgi:hypothetical protein